MWEFAIVVENTNEQIINYLYSSLKIGTSRLDGVTALYREKNNSHIIIAVDQKNREKAQTFIIKCLQRTICLFFKSDFLDKKLLLPIKDEMNMLAFKKALIGFDKETDYYIISRSISFNKALYLESFYNFKLSKLRDKWLELISLANENREYLLSKDAFMDLLRFLVDNIDISEEEIDVVEDDDGYRIFSGHEENSLAGLSKEGLVSSVIELSPQKINLYCKEENSATLLIKNIYDQRVNQRFSSAEKDCLTFFKI